jgi:RNA polymerase sigma-70 factor, ECF subfamily
MGIRGKATREVTETAETTSGSSPSLSAGRSDHGPAGALVGRLFAEHSRMVLGLCRLLLRDPVEAEDATQQVFLSAHRAVLGGSLPREPPAWLAAIARNECRLRIRARMREPLVLPDLPSDLPDPLAAAIRTTDLEAIWAAISSLPRRQRRALVLREVGGLSYHELGRALGVSQSSVESLLFRARQHVRALVAAATPLALRDDLARLIPGFDPGSAGLAARAASLPVAVKFATAAVSVGLVTTGAAQFPEHHVHSPVTAQAMTSQARSSPVEHVPTLLAAERRPSVFHPSSAPTREQNDSDRSDQKEGQHTQGSQPQEQDNVQPTPEPAEVEAAQVEPTQEGPSHQEGSDSSGSGDSGSSGGDSQPDGSDG